MQYSGGHTCRDKEPKIMKAIIERAATQSLVYLMNFFSVTIIFKAQSYAFAPFHRPRNSTQRGGRTSLRWNNNSSISPLSQAFCTCFADNTRCPWFILITKLHFKIRKIDLPHKISDSFPLVFEGIFPTDVQNLSR